MLVMFEAVVRIFHTAVLFRNRDLVVKGKLPILCSNSARPSWQDSFVMSPALGGREGDKRRWLDHGASCVGSS